MKPLNKLCLTVCACLSFAGVGCVTTETKQPTSDIAAPTPADTLQTELPHANKRWPFPRATDLSDDTSYDQRWVVRHQTQQKLDQRISVHWSSIALHDAIDEIRKETGTNIVVNWPALELVGIEPLTHIQLTLKQVKASIVLDLVLQMVSADAFGDDKAGYAITDNLVKISTKRDLNSDTLVRVYDIRWLMPNRERAQIELYTGNERAMRLATILDHDGWLRLERKPVYDLSIALSGTQSTHHKEVEMREKLKLRPNDLTRRAANPPMKPMELWDWRLEMLRETIIYEVGDASDWIGEVYYMKERNGYLRVQTTLENHAVLENVLAMIQRVRAEDFKQRIKTIEVMLLLQEAEALRLDQSYEEALMAVRKALRIDPKSMEANALKEVLVDTIQR